MIYFIDHLNDNFIIFFKGKTYYEAHGIKQKFLAIVLFRNKIFKKSKLNVTSCILGNLLNFKVFKYSNAFMYKQRILKGELVLPE